MPSFPSPSPPLAPVPLQAGHNLPVVLILTLPPSSTGLPEPGPQPRSSGSILPLGLHSSRASSNTPSLCYIVPVHLHVSPLPPEVFSISEPPCNSSGDLGREDPTHTPPFPTRGLSLLPRAPAVDPTAWEPPGTLCSLIPCDMSYWVVTNRSSHKPLLPQIEFISGSCQLTCGLQVELVYRAGPQTRHQAPCHSPFACQVSWALPELQPLETKGMTSTASFGLGKLSLHRS